LFAGSPGPFLLSLIRTNLAAFGAYLSAFRIDASRAWTMSAEAGALGLWVTARSGLRAAFFFGGVEPRGRTAAADWRSPIGLPINVSAWMATSN
jgi:hypothetical protein